MYIDLLKKEKCPRVYNAEAQAQTLTQFDINLREIASSHEEDQKGEDPAMEITLDGNNPPIKAPFSTDIKNPPELRSPQNLIMEGEDGLYKQHKL